MQKINIGIDKIDKIFHLSDIHIRNLKRHTEYRTVFSRTAKQIKKLKGPNDIIFLGGDIVHAKTDMTPELVQEVYEFLKLMADTAPTILITGNHDTNLNNKSRLDALSPIVSALNHPNLFYLKSSDIYEIADKHFVVMSVFDKPKDFIRANDFVADYKIALHHGAVDNAMTDIGFRLVNDNVTIDLFSGYDLVLLGDIHKPAQFLNDAGTIAYVGSLIQQGHSESLHHGILVWDTEKKYAEFHEIPNDICYYTLEINNSKYTPIPDELLKKSIRLRVKVNHTDSADLKEIIAEIKAKFQISELTIQRINDFTKSKNRIQKINVGDVRDVEYQNSLISKYLQDKLIDDETLDGIRHVNRTVNSGLPKLEISRNISWIPKKFEFSNMFSYGENNVIDFSNMRGVYGLFAPNASGKSTLLDSITYCIFDKCGRTSKASSVMNNKSNSFTCKFNFELDGKNYFIEKQAVRGRGAHVRVDVDFYTVDDLGNVESLNGKERSDTNNSIRNILGNYEDFVLTALSVQNNSSGFIDMSQRDRKDLLAQFLDINIFEELYTIANQDIKEVATLVKEYQKQDFSTQLATAVVDIDLYTQEHKNYQIDKVEVEEKIRGMSLEILKLTEELIPIDKSIVDINSLMADKDKIEKLIKQINTSITSTQNKILVIEQDLSTYQSQLNSYDSDLIENNLNLLKDARLHEKHLASQAESLKIDLKHKVKKMENLNDLEYDENCPYCMNNVFVKDAINTKNSIESDKERSEKIYEQLRHLQDQISDLSKFELQQNEIIDLNRKINSLNTLKLTTETDLHKFNSMLHQSDGKLKDVSFKIDEYYKKEDAIKKNKLTQKKIDELNSDLSIQNDSLSFILDDILKCHSNLIVAEQTKLNAEASIQKLKEYEKKFKFYEYYLEAVSRDGVPYDLITSAVPYIEQEINNILIQLVDFNLMLEMDGKNINCYIVYDNDNFWPIELTSGMEKFIASLAIRTALINVSSLPRPNFLAVDEGFGVLDTDNLNSMFNLFDYLKTQFSFILIISHIDSMRDVVDKLIEITKADSKSKINFV